MEVGEAHAGHAEKAQILYGGGIQGNRVVEKLMKIKDAGYPLAVQEDSILFFRVHSGRIQFTFPLEEAVVHGRSRGPGHDGIPEMLHFMAFREKRWPPISMRLPEKLTVLERPPAMLSFSRIRG